jgi:hypothetical protein
MPASPSPWQPTKIRRFVRSFDTGAGTVLVDTDCGKGYVKAIGNPGGEHVLACEWVGTQLAKWFGLPTFDFALVHVTEIDEIPFRKGGKASPGPAFITREETGQPWSGKERELKRLINPQNISRLVVFDTWTRNCDRHSVRTGHGKRIKYDNVFLSGEAPKGRLVLKAMDHTHCFTCGADLTAKEANLDRIKDHRVYGLFRQFRPFLDSEAVTEAVARLRSVTDAVVQKMIATIPKEWDVSESARKALATLLLARAAFVADNIVDAIWPQQELDFTDEPEDES